MLQTDRLLLRQWTAEDKKPFAKLNADPEVMRFFPKALTRNESDGLVDRFIDLIDRQGWGIFALEERASGDFVGMTGLNRPTWEAHFTPCVEIGWRLARKHWGKGYASEAALACIDLARDPLALKEIVSFTSTLNTPSIAVMQRIGMKRDHDGDFFHPSLDPADPLALHVLYRLSIK